MSDDGTISAIQGSAAIDAQYYSNLAQMAQSTPSQSQPSGSSGSGG